MAVDTAEYKYKIGELRQTLAWMDIVLSNIADSVCVIKQDGTILFINDAFSEMIKKPRLELLGQKIEDTIRLKPKASTYPEAFPFDENFARSSDSTRGIYQWHVNEHESLTVKLIAHHIKANNQIVVMLQNITNEYEREEIGRNFAHLASHQLKTPLTTVKMQAHMLVDGYMGDLDPAQLKSTTTILDAAQHMNELLTMLLEVSKLEHNKYVRNLETCDIRSIIDRVQTETAEKAKDKSIALNVKAPSKIRPISSDPHMLHEIFSNIVTNAIKYTPDDGSVTITVTESPDEVTVSVQDSGIGIPVAVQDKIFSQFFRAENAIESSQAGTGLGLYLVRQLVELLDGQIWFTSDHDTGTTFWVSLPVAAKVTA